MPLYIFECQDCGCESEEVVSRKVKEIECPSCGGLSARALSRDVSSTCKNGNIVTVTTQKTGIQDLDFDFDRVIGEDSRVKWDKINRRNAYKQSVLDESPGAESSDLSRNPDGTYVVMDAETKAFVTQVREEAHKA